MLTCLKYGLEDLHNQGKPPYAIFHMYVKYDGMETYFMFHSTGPDRFTLKQLREGQVLEVLCR